MKSVKRTFLLTISVSASLVILASFSLGGVGCLDYIGGCNYDSLCVDRDTAGFGDSLTITAFVSGKNSDKMMFVWDAPDGGTFIEFPYLPSDYIDTSQVHWVVPNSQGQYEIICEAGGNSVNMDAKSVEIEVIEE
ncbi:hypothetical protein JXM67_03395 [candidate division WOR-3 bacterium]|nr:hypothetical protein [candidate division WOR-3 bacterium]